jgi:hypothetical protein
MRQLIRRRSFRSVLALTMLPLMPAAGQVPAWIVGAKPLTAIGTAEGSADQELANVSGAHRMVDGRVVIANGKPLELRIYNARGVLLSRVGRKGGGPGEFQGRLDLLPAGGDSLLIFDQGSQRTLLFGIDGKLLREWPPTTTGSFRGQVILYRQSFSRPDPSLSGCLRQALAALPPVAIPAFREVHVDGAGHYLVRLDRATKWTAYSSNGTPVGTFQLPAKFEVYEFGRNYVVGKALLEDDIEQVQVLGVGIPPASRAREACSGRTDSFPDANSARAAEFRTALRAAMTAGEMAYSNYATYVSSIDSLPNLKDKLPAGSAFRVLRATNRGWAAAIYDRRSTLVCIFAEADAALLGWADGRIKCSE